MSKKAYAIPGLTALLTALFACQFSPGFQLGTNTAPPSEPSAEPSASVPTLEPSITPTGPVWQREDFPVFALIDAQGNRLEGTPGGYCWFDECLLVEVQPEPEVFHDIPAGPLTIDFDGVTPEEVYLFLTRDSTYGDEVDSAEPAPQGSQFTWEPDLAPGQYVLSIQAYWSNNDSLSCYIGMRVY